jgi:hypothetical protein
MILQRRLPVEDRIGKNFPNVTEGKIQFPEEKNLLQSFQIRMAIVPVSGLRHLTGLQKTDLIVIMESSDRYSGQICNFAYLHGKFQPFRSLE